MELEMSDVLNSLSVSLERLSAAANALEETAAKLELREATVSGDVQKITAAVEVSDDMPTRREFELERKLALAEQRISDLLAQSETSGGNGMTRRVELQASRSATRKTLPAATVQLLAKQGIDALDAMDTQSLDAALAGLSIEQRIAVKSQLLRSGTVIS